MARKSEEIQYVQDILTPDEAELFKVATSGDQFIPDGYRMYGEGWPDHIPRTEDGYILINLAAQYLFGWQFQDYQACPYYCPIDDAMVHGGRGSGKTEGLAIALALRATFHPGLNWLHTAPSIEQSKVMYDILEVKGQQGHYHRIFWQHDRVAPAPDIELRPWDEYDPGTKFFFRSQGGHGGKPMELLRSLTAGIVSSDESFRVNTNDYFVRILTGIARGPNEYLLNSNPDLKDEYNQRVFDIQSEPDIFQRKRLQDDLETWIEKMGIAKDIYLMLTGNAGPWGWEWRRYKYGLKHPGRRWVVTWTSDDNLFYTNKQKKLLKQQFEDDPDGLRVEMMAERPKAIGDVFVQEHLDNLFDEDLETEALAATEEREKGWKYIRHHDYDLVHYRKPPEKDALYAAGGDPGTGRVPHRNKWVNLVARIDRRPFEIVYACTGNLSRWGQGSIRPWIADCQHILKTYPMMEGHFAAEAGATQRHVHEVVWPDDLLIVPLNMGSIKTTLAMKAQLMLEASMFVAPPIQMMEQELAGYQFTDKKLDQDWVMAFLALVFVVWPHVADEFDLSEEEDDEDEFYDHYDADRDTRLSEREVRLRR